MPSFLLICNNEEVFIIFLHVVAHPLPSGTNKLNCFRDIRVGNFYLGSERYLASRIFWKGETGF